MTDPYEGLTPDEIADYNYQVASYRSLSWQLDMVREKIQMYEEVMRNAAAERIRDEARKAKASEGKTT